MMNCMNLMRRAAWLVLLSVFIVAGCSTSDDSTPGTTEPECTVNEECPIGETCQDGVCRPEGYLPCTSHDECPVGMFCVDGMCSNSDPVDGDKDDVLPADGDDQTDTDTDADSDPVVTDGDTDPGDSAGEQDVPLEDFLCHPCTTDPECPGDMNFCIEDNTGSTFCGATCRNTADCPSDYLCKNFPYGNQCVPLDGFCAESCVDTGCGEGMACDPDTGVCKPVGTGTQDFCEPCTNNSECIEGGICIPDATGNTFCGVNCLDAPCDIPNTYCRRIDETTRQCWPMNNACASGCNCDTVTCANHTACNAMDCQCYPDNTHCSNVGCNAGLNCDPTTGDCVEGQVANCCTDPSICAYGTTCNSYTCQCETPSGSCTSDDQCAPGQICESFFLQMCIDEYCTPCSSSFDCASFFSSCIDGGCANQCTSDAQCPSGAHCQIDFFSGYCVPDSGTCSGEDPCGGVTYEGECRGNDLYWCEDNVLGHQVCDDVPALCQQYENDYYCRPVEGGPCGGSNPPCAIGYECVNEVCHATVDGDTDTVDTDPDVVDSDPDPVDSDPEITETVEDACGGVPATGECRGDVLYWCDNGTTKVENCTLLTAAACAQHSDSVYYCIGNEGASCDSRHPCTTGLQCIDGTCRQQTGGTLGDPCPDGYDSDCDPNATDDCLSNNDQTRTLCSMECVADAACSSVVDGYCCRAISGGNLFCLPPDFCTDNGAGTCLAPIDAAPLPFTDSDTLSGDSNFRGGCSGYGGWGPEKIYRISLNAGDRVQVQLTASTPSVDYQLYLADGCGDDSYTLCYQQDSGYEGENETLTRTVSAAGVYYIIVDSFDDLLSGSYTIRVNVL